ncbi:MAG: DUF1972 domain-containing protein [Prevotella sp.]
MKRIAIVGTQGVPANYGGFETLVENLIGEFKSQDVEYTVFCSAKDYKTKMKTYKGAKLKYIHFLHANGIQSIPYDILSLLRCIHGYDTVLLLGVSGGLFLPVFRKLFKKKLIVNIDGLEHKRAKWGLLARTILKLSEKMAVRYADVIIADNKGIQNYVTETYNKKSEMIAYGGDHALRFLTEERQTEILGEYLLEKNKYALSICRIEPENNCHITLDAFAKCGHPLVFIGNWSRSQYGQRLRWKYGLLPNIKMFDSIYDLDVLYTLRNNCNIYIHGHSAGGTNPSLVEAMFFGRPILAYDVIYNRETTYDKAYFFKNDKELISLCGHPEMDGRKLLSVAYGHYCWTWIVKQYESLF